MSVRDYKGDWVEMRALLDTCATVNLITSRRVKALKIPSQPCSVSITSVNDIESTVDASVNINVRSLINKFEKTLSCLVVNKISEREPSVVFPREKIKLPAGLPLADANFHKPRPVDILIGAGTALSVIQSGQINLNSYHSDLIMHKTRFGWVVVGGLEENVTSKINPCHLTKLQEQMERFWRIEEIGGVSETTSEQALCEIHYSKNTKRGADGRYIVRLPFRHEKIELGESRTQALRRFYSLQKKLNAKPEMKKEYHRVMQEYVELGHLLPVLSETDDGYYMPHHAVLKESSATTKLRVVFDASAKTSNGVSLNQVLMVGPTIQDKIFGHLLRFRVHVYVITADIEKMYRQITIHPADRKYLRVFWYDKNSKIVPFESQTVTFGVSSSAHLATRTLEQLAIDERDEFPLACEAIRRDFYVDDMNTGADTLAEALQLRNDIIEVLRRGGFNIRKWGSNHKHALDNIRSKVFGSDNATIEGSITKTLGVAWNSVDDTFVHAVKPITNTEKYTKRYILSEIAKIFDPLGLLGPIVLTAKLFMQECWKSNIDWDESISNELASRWTAFIGQLNDMNAVSIKRRVLIDEPVDIQIHGFCDASKHGYGSCLYVRSVNARGEIYVNLVCSKSRVAPLKADKCTIPRLELSGALILARLYEEVKTILNLKVSRAVMWTDSTIVLQWLKKPYQTLKIFESNRVKEIQRLGKEVSWKHVRTHQNPADALSRGQFPNEFANNEIWFSGPKWLRENEQHWPELENLGTDGSLWRTDMRVLVTTSSVSRQFYVNCSSYNKILNFISLIIRALKRKSFKTKKEDGPVTINERRHAEIQLLKLIQREQFAKEIDELSKNNSVRSPKLSALCPFFDQYGVIRVGGRLKRSELTFNQKHPILLPSRHYITDLIIGRAHLDNYHAGNSSTLFAVRQRFYLLDGKNQVRKVIRSCVECLRFKPKPMQAQMSDLPSARVREAAPFQHVGIDYFGPLYLKEKKFRNRTRVKAYGCVFVCMSTKAVHIEIASDLSTEGFLFAFRRFISRRAIPSHVYSDNGTNFVGASKQLRELFCLLQSKTFSEKIHSFAVRKNIEWHFNPPESPHFGGIWEAAVKSFKHHLKRVLGDRLVTYEEMYTLGAEIEAILNSRPLYYVSSDPNDILAITPAHVLVGKPLTLLPEENFLCIPENRLAVHKSISRIRQDFWQRWYLEYLHELQRRQKWYRSKGAIKVGSVVVLMDKQQPCGRWPLAIITEVHPGDDDIIRVVTVRTSQGSYVRNINSICPLPPHDMEMKSK